MRKAHYGWLAALLVLTMPAVAESTNAAAIAAVLRADRELDGLAFSEVIEATTGRRVVPIDLQRQLDRDLIRMIGLALDEVLRRMNAANSVAQRQRRINEVSSHFENELKSVLGAMPDFACDFPRTAAGRVQRSGYPDLRLVHQPSGTVVYVDPKLFEQGSRASTLRTFYYEPKTETGKIHDDAHHLIAGIEHDGRAGGKWRFLQWELVDASRLRVRLKAEFQSSNKEMYRPKLIVGSSRERSATSRDDR